MASGVEHKLGNSSFCGFLHPYLGTKDSRWHLVCVHSRTEDEGLSLTPIIMQSTVERIRHWISGRAHIS